MRRLLPSVLVVSGLFATTGCQTVMSVFRPLSAAREALRSGPAPSSNRTFEDALAKATALCAGDPNLRVARVAATGSMLPYLGSSSLVVIDSLSEGAMRPGALVTFVKGGAEFIHVNAGLVSGGIVTTGSDPAIEEVVLESQITGSTLATIFFDPATMPPDGGKLPLLLAAAAEHIPAQAGRLRILGATTSRAGEVSAIKVSGPGEYQMVLRAGGSVRLSVGVPDASLSPAEVDLSWSPALAGKTVNFQIYHPSAPDLGLVLVATDFAEGL